MATELITLQTPAEAVAWLRAQGATSLTTDSRSVAPHFNAAFVAWPGAAVDGRQFARQALASGAVAVLVEKAGFDEFDFSQSNSYGYARIAAYPGLKKASGEIASLFYDQPSQQLDIAAFTGTNGKTSSSWWLAQALSSLPGNSQQRCAIVGTLGTGTIGAIEDNGLTTPDPVLLQARLKTFVDAGCQTVALEASSIGIAEGRLNGTRIHTAIFTNFTQDHLDYHGSMDAYWQAKAALFAWPNLKAAVINIDDPQGLALVDRLTNDVACKNIDLWTVSIHKSARLQAVHIRTTTTGLTFGVMEGTELHSLQTSLVGRYNVSNLLGVIATMRSLGIPLAACVLACQQITPVPGRLEVIATSVDVQHPPTPLVVVDYAHTPDALDKALMALREIAALRGGKLWCIFGCGGNRDASKRPIMGATARAHADFVVVTSDNPRGEAPGTIVAQILLGLEADARVQVQLDRALAIADTIQQAATSDVIVIAGKGHEQYQEIAGIKHPFSDQAHAKAALGVWGAAA